MTDEATPDTGTDPAVEPEATEPAQPDVEQLQAEIDKWKSLARKHEDKSKANAKAQQELERLRQARVGDAFRIAAAAGREIDVDTLLEGVDLSKFLDEDGNPDTVKVGDWVERVAPVPEPSTTPKVPDLGQGARPTPPGLNSSQLQKDLMAKLGIS